MHRDINPWCTCDSIPVADAGVCLTPAPENCTEDIMLFLGQPYFTKPSIIRAYRGHRSWMTHLPLSRPDSLGAKLGDSTAS